MEHATPLSPELLLRHEAFVLRLARTLVRGEADAEEVAQRTLVSALEHPPRHGGLRAWLARVTRNHAIELHRSQRRRSAREERAARPEAVAPGESALERLELEHGVVRAVLALEEPYRSVVVATYYEGLAPADIAARRGVPAGTVRSQLSRAHDLLRAKLDREHGERAGWMRGLTGLLALRGEPAAAATAPAAAPGLAWPLAVGAGVAACVAGAFALRAALAPPSAAELVAVGPPAAPSVAAAPGVQDPASMDSGRVAAGPSASAQAAQVAGFAPANEPAQLLEQSRQIKRLILERRLAVTPDERARAGIHEDTAASGVVRLLDRNAFGYAYSLPWMREGGSYYSFTERVHDFNRRPQVSLEGGLLGGQFLLVDLGQRRLADIPASRVPPAWLAPAGALLWELAWADLEQAETTFQAVREQRIQEAEVRGTLDPSEARAARNQNPTARAGRAFLLRSIAQDEHDVLVAIEVIDVEPDQCTLAYRILHVRPIPNPRALYVAPDASIQLPPPPPELARRSEPELRAALDAVRLRADELLFDRIPPEVEQRFGALRGRADAGLARLAPYMSVWSELTTDFLGRADVAFLARGPGGSGDVLFQGQGEHATLGAAGGGGSVGAFVDLGTVPLEAVTTELVAAQGELGAYLAQHEFPRPIDLPPDGPAREAALRAARDAEHAAANAFRSRVHALGSSDRAPARAGGTFALRSVHFGDREFLAAVHVAWRDDHGAVVAWRVLKTW